jgi:amino acid adenylation domain-containing protein
MRYPGRRLGVRRRSERTTTVSRTNADLQELAVEKAPGNLAGKPPPPAASLSEAKRLLRERRLRGEFPAARKPPQIPRQTDRAQLPLSFAQQRLWFFHQLDPASPLYNMPLALRLRGTLDVASLRHALNAIAARHETLRTRFLAPGGEPVQVIDPPGEVPLGNLSLVAEPEDGCEERLHRTLTELSEQPFDLAREHPIHATLVELAANDHVLVLVVHHIAGDGWSWGVFMHELSELYRGFCTGAPASLPEPSIQYADFAVWQRQRLSGPALDQLVGYWKNKLAHAQAVLELPTDHPRQPVQTFRGRWESRLLGRPLRTALEGLSQRSGGTLFMTLLAAYGVLLSRYSGQKDVIVATPIAGRTHLQLESLIGFFVNTLAMRLDLSGEPAFRDFLARVRDTAIAAFAHQELPFEKLVEELHPARCANHLPLAQVAFVLQNTRSRALQLPGVEATQLESWTRTAKFDLTLCVDDSVDGLLVAIEYNTDLFSAATATRLLEQYEVLLQGIVADAQQTVSDLPLLTAAAREQLLAGFNATARPFPRAETVPALIEAQVRRAPDAVALTYRERRMTYRELNGRANRVARRLRKLGVGPNDLVAICLERSPEMIVALLGILKSGGAYVSLDPAYPKERLAFMLEDSAAKVVLTVDALRGVLPDPTGTSAATADLPAATVLTLDGGWGGFAAERDNDPPPVGDAENPAYVSYTSGSTGRPKGVSVPHRAINRLLLNTDYVQFEADDAVLQMANCAFDASTFEIWGALLHGARIVIVPQEVALAPRELAQEIAARGVTAMFVTTALFNQLALHARGIFQPLRHVLFGGEAVNPACVRDVLQHDPPRRLLHVYGPTETTTFATWFEIREVPENATTIPIGRPLANTTLYVLDERRQPVPIGVPGELYIGGDGVAHGYLNRPELTAERFVPDPFSPVAEARLYRTGDRVRWLADGTIEFLGRLDRQVKIRGFRVELEEIELALARHPDVKQAVVALHEPEPGERRLTAYIAPRDQPAPAPATWREHLRRTLPDYMVPAAFVCLPELPLNANGKVDRAALPAPEGGRDTAGADFVAPRNDTERRLAEIWEAALNVHPVGVHDNFFELGGHSLSGVRLFARIEEQFGRKLSLATLFQAPTVARLAELLRTEEAAGTGGPLVGLQPCGSRTPLFFVHGAGVGNLWTYANLAPHLDPDQPVYALESRTTRGLEEFARIEDMAVHYVAEIKRVQPHGPYFLSGYCFGGVVAYEMACQLVAAGEAVGLLALLDSAPPNSRYHRLPWWRPTFVVRFAANTFHWLRDFVGVKPEERRAFVQRKLRSAARKLGRWIRRQPPGTDLDLESAIDTTVFPHAELDVWRAHLRACQGYHPGCYPGRVTLFRTRGQPLFCSLDPQFGWGDLAAAVDVVIIPGSHEKIFMEPHVRTLAAELDACAAAAQSMEGDRAEQ